MGGLTPCQQIWGSARNKLVSEVDRTRVCVCVCALQRLLESLPGLTQLMMDANNLGHQEALAVALAQALPRWARPGWSGVKTPVETLTPTSPLWLFSEAFAAGRSLFANLKVP